MSGPLAGQLTAASRGVLDGAQPFVLMTLRGRLYLRMQLDAPDAAAIDAAVAIFETAAAQAVLAAEGIAETHDAGPATATTAWQTQFPPHDAGR